MSDPTVVLLSRIQFGFVMSFHIIFPAFTIGLASWLAFLAGAYLKRAARCGATCSVLAEDLRRVVRARRRVGHRHGFQFGTNWAELSTRRQHPRAAARV